MMKWIKPRRVEWLSFWIMMPVLAAMLNYAFFDSRIFTDYKVWLFSFPLIYVQGLISWYVHIVVMHWLRIKFPNIKQTALRLTILALAHIFLTSTTFLLIIYSYDALNFLDYELGSSSIQTVLLMAIALTMVATTMWESDYTFKLWKDSLAEKEKMQQLTLQQEFDTLKSQVNPHFLFNCFNTLSSLITEDKDQAECFLDELSKVYRYLLRNNTDGLTTLENEMRFIQSYYNLLKTRYGDGLHMVIEIDKRYNQYVIPSLSLQLLVENAVKHNVVSKSSPLIIDIFTAAGNILVINNNLQPKASKLVSNNIGLENIRSKYDLIKQSGFQVLKDEHNFSVILPLIWGPVLENHIVSIGEKRIYLTHHF